MHMNHFGPPFGSAGLEGSERVVLGVQWCSNIDGVGRWSKGGALERALLLLPHRNCTMNTGMQKEVQGSS